MARAGVPPLPPVRDSAAATIAGRVSQHTAGGTTTAALRARSRPQAWGGPPLTGSTKSAYEPLANRRLHTAHLFFATVPGTRFVRVGPHETAAALYPHGMMPHGVSTKILWEINNPHAVVLGLLTIDGRNLAGGDTMHQLVPRAVGPTDYPSIVNIPTPGCWQLRVQIASLTGARLPFRGSVAFVVIKE